MSFGGGIRQGRWSVSKSKQYKKSRYLGVRICNGKKGITYEVSYYPFPGAKKKYLRVEATSEKEAFIKRAQLMGEKPKYQTQEFSFPELKERLKLKCQADKDSPKTIINLMGKFHTLFEEFLPLHYPHVKSINELNQQIIERYKQFIVVDKKRENGWRDELTKIKSIFRKMVAIGCCEERICANVLAKFAKPKRELKVYKEITIDQKREFLKYIKEDRPDLYGITFFIMRLGWRREQVISLKRTDIKFIGVKPVEIVCQPQNTKNKEPFVLRNFGNDITDVLNEYYQLSRGYEWLFPNRKGNKVHSNNYSNYISETSEKVLKIRLTPHDFRHMFCTHAKKEGLPERDIMAITGHKDIGSFQIYTHATGEGVKKVLDSSKIF